MGDKLSEIDSLINWEDFRPIEKDMYDNKTDKGGRPNIDEIIMIKILVLQELQRQLNAKGLKMKRSVKGHPIGIWDILRNKRISKKRAPGERPYAVMKNVFKSSHVMVTTSGRAAVKMVFASIGFNLYQLLTLKKQGII